MRTPQLQLSCCRAAAPQETSYRRIAQWPRWSCTIERGRSGWSAAKTSAQSVESEILRLGSGSSATGMNLPLEHSERLSGYHNPRLASGSLEPREPRSLLARFGIELTRAVMGSLEPIPFPPTPIGT